MVWFKIIFRLFMIGLILVIRYEFIFLSIWFNVLFKYCLNLIDKFFLSKLLISLLILVFIDLRVFFGKIVVLVLLVIKLFNKLRLFNEWLLIFVVNVENWEL